MMLTTAEQMRIHLENNLHEENRINQDLILQVKALEEETVWLVENQKNQIRLETDLRRALLVGPNLRSR